MLYICDLFLIFIFIFIMINRACSFAYSLECVLLFLDDIVMKNVNNFQIAKFQPQGDA